MSEKLTIGFLPLVDACLPILARELGFAEEEGLDLALTRDVTWATVLDRLLYGHTDAAHMLAPLAIATTMGIGRPPQKLAAPFVLGLNGNAITLRTELADAVCPEPVLGDPAAVGAALAKQAEKAAANGRTLRFGVVHRHSSHNYMLRYWLSACGIRPDVDIEIVTVAPPFSADALESGEIDGSCVGEPWNSVAVDRGAGRIVLATAQIWRRGVEKVLAVKEARLGERSEAVEGLIRAMRQAGKWFVDPANRESAAAILARPEYLDGSAEIIGRDIADEIVLEAGRGTSSYPDFMFQYNEAANFPWISQAKWLYSQLILWEGKPFDTGDAERAGRVFRPDVYRQALRGTGDLLPGASSKVEGSIDGSLAVGAEQGRITLSSNGFFDGRIFDPDEVEAYVAGQR
ncbi:MAG: NitT/TauT family transport system ATP-binding protein [Afipia broomeae]|jgi:NitT/TauT family transport system ATP-binding protein|uniref:CmpA/NrtA family ABC transporter substrate-binding protein n=1 Tax=Qipengyuania TaxID=1855416 RepID=UPI0007C33099|nr:MULTISPECIES: CmpA/NrtA family ABC transporter substrate-binding protein [Qipengyuania]KZX52690.1 nitrate transporter [Erythrobacter sp. HI00D59]WPL57869.1 CmpA/NrtA family ABC transporter substrate-binding protein [Qipengyuania sp. HL-TH5]MBW3169439.1 ABC transporter substrate-binding protein [Qipengyuania flava]MBY5966677.1 ABC transporter substrate-binding protein [Qipengyuania flava]MBY6013001.1 ABC transporter substrate-binding protein [Qipengyuania flava]